MPLYRLDSAHKLIPLDRGLPTEDEYAQTMATLAWNDPEAFLGRPLLPVAISPDIGVEVNPGAMFLDQTAHLVLVEFARQGTRDLLAGYIDHVSWAANAGMESIAALYHRGPQRFTEDWRAFSPTELPERPERPPWLVIVAADLYGRDIASFNFLLETSVVLCMVRAAIYTGSEGERILGVERDDVGGI